MDSWIEYTFCHNPCQWNGSAECVWSQTSVIKCFKSICLILHDLSKGVKKFHDCLKRAGYANLEEKKNSETTLDKST